ncbi:MAG: polysaccharide deacetylase family protein [Rhodocyclaceae bacterium]|nr:polysaccharide deacetylase family protein [Rhodocyclaceae bacterium]
MMLRSVLNQLSPSGGGARLTILILHRVLARPDPLMPDIPDAGRFARMLSWLASWFVVLPLAEGISRLLDGRLPARALAISFDDGYADNAEVALPILKEYGASATFFIATGFLDGGTMWNDRVIESIRGTTRTMLDLGTLGQFATGSVAERRTALKNVIDAIKYLDPSARTAAVERVVEASGVMVPDGLMMSTEAVRSLARAGMGVGAHTRTHPILTRLDTAEARAEIAGGRAELEAITGRRVELFAYPNGRPGRDYGAEHVAIVRELGFLAAVTTAAGVATTGTDRFQLPRYTPWEQDKLRFGLRLAQNLTQIRPVMVI